MRDNRRVGKQEFLAGNGRARRNCYSRRDECRVYVVAGIGFRQLMCWSRFMLALSRAAGLVSARTRLARLFSWRAGENA